MLAFFVGSIVVGAGIFALITFLLGLWARWSLSPIDEPNLAAGVRTILRKWVVGALVLGGLTILSDVIFQWRGERFAVRGTPDAIAENIGHVGGMAIVCVAVWLNHRVFLSPCSQEGNSRRHTEVKVEYLGTNRKPRPKHGRYF
jgi:hypothetical protein